MNGSTDGDPRSIAGRVMVVTGAASGMGRATATLLARHGARVSCWDLNGEAIEETARLATDAAGDAGEALAVVADVSDSDSVADAHLRTVADLGRVDGLVNNAGISLPAALDSPEWTAAWDRTMAVNLTGPANVLRTCIEDLCRNGDGRVVNIASTEGLGATRYLSAYTTAKHGVIGFTRSAAMELAGRGVTVNCICPGPIHTGMTAIIPDDDKERFARRRVPMRRYGDPAEVAQMTMSLLLPANTYTTGAVLAVDGGLTVQNT